MCKREGTRDQVHRFVGQWEAQQVCAQQVRVGDVLRCTLQHRPRTIHRDCFVPESHKFRSDPTGARRDVSRLPCGKLTYDLTDDPFFGSDERMMRLLLAICYENITTGLALTAFVAYVSSIVSKKYGAIQYALLSSLLSLVGTLGRGAVGEAFDTYGYAPVFRWTAATALISTVFVLLEWARVTAQERRQAAELPADVGAKATEALAETGEPAR